MSKLYRVYYFSANISFLSLRYLPSKIYTSGADMKIEEYEPNITHIPIVKENSLTAQVQRKNINTITTNTAKTVPKDLLMVCRRLSSNIFPNNIFLPEFIFRFSLILSKIIIVSLILYPILVSTAIIKIVFTAIVWSNIIRTPYAHAGKATSKIIVKITTPASMLGEISFLTPAKEKII